MMQSYKNLFKYLILWACCVVPLNATLPTPGDLSNHVEEFYLKAYTKERVDLSICKTFDTTEHPFQKQTHQTWLWAVDALTNYLMFFFSNDGIQLVSQTPFFTAPLRLAKAHYLETNEFVVGNQPKNRMEVLKASLKLYDGVWHNYQSFWLQTLQEIETTPFGDLRFSYWADDERETLMNAYAAFFEMSGFANSQKEWSSVKPTQKQTFLATLQSIANPFPLDDLPRFGWLVHSIKRDNDFVKNIYAFACRLNAQNEPPLTTPPLEEWLASGQSPVERGIQGVRAKFQPRRSAI